jgi:hypothetical protein
MLAIPVANPEFVLFYIILMHFVLLLFYIISFCFGMVLNVFSVYSTFVQIVIRVREQESSI